MWPKVGIAVLNHNGRKWIADCLDSLARAEYPNLEITVVDNASADGSRELIHAGYAWARVLALDENLGFAAAYNRFIERCDCQYVVLLNNDTRAPDPAWVYALVNAMERDRSIAAATCKMLYLNESQFINSIGGMAFWSTGSFDIGDGEPDKGQYDNPPVEPFAFCGGAAMLRVAAFREAGGFDEMMFAYREDFDLSWRLRLRGYRVAYVPEARILHSGGGTWGRLSYAKLYFSSRNWLRAMLKNYSASTLLTALPGYLIFEFAVRIPGLAWVHRDPRFALIPFRNVAWNLAHAKDTFRARRRVQTHREVSDRTITRAMGGGGAFESLKHLFWRASVLRGMDASSLGGHDLAHGTDEKRRK